MKSNHIKSVLFILLFITSFIYSQENISQEKYDQIEDNLLVGLTSSNTGLNISCAYFLGEMKSTKSINGLLSILKNSDIDEERIIAALSLSKIKSDQAMFAVKQRIKFDDSERVQRICEIFYNNYLSELSNDNNSIDEGEEMVDLNMNYNGIKLAEFASME